MLSSILILIENLYSPEMVAIKKKKKEKKETKT